MLNRTFLTEDLFSTQFGDRLRVPEAVGVFLGLLQRLGEVRAQREEVKGFLDFLLLLLWQRVQLLFFCFLQNKTRKGHISMLRKV